MSKKLIKNRQFNVGIVESYKADKQETGHGTDSPILGSFSVNGMTVENTISQNRTKYSAEVWAQPTAFGKGGKFVNESGKLKPTTLLGSVDHPLDDRAEILLGEAAIAWYDVKRNSDGSWDGKADILNNPQGRIVKTFLDYAKMRGGGDLLGVSSRALGESRLEESGDGQYEAIVPESFELMSFDFVYNPSFQTATANINEAKSSGKLRSLTESIKSLADEDKEHSKYYKTFVENFDKLGFDDSEDDSEDETETKTESTEKPEEKPEENKPKTEGKSVKKAKEEYYKTLRAKEHELYNAIYDLEEMDDDEFEQKYGKVEKSKVLNNMQEEYKEVKEELETLKNKKSKQENTQETEKEKIQEAKQYSIELSKDKAKKLAKALKEEEIPYEPSEAGDLVHFEIKCDKSQKEAIEKFLHSISESTDVIKESTYKFEEENKTIGEFVDDAKEAEKDIFDEPNDEDDESDDGSDDEDDDSDDEELELELDDEDEDETLDEEEIEELTLEEQVASLTNMVQEIYDAVVGLEDSEEVILDDEDELEDIEDLDEDDEEDDDEETDDEEDFTLEDLTEEDLDELSDEELEALLDEVDE